MKDKIPTKEILNERFSQLPEVIQDIILESNWKDVIRRITTTYNLHIDQGGTLEAITLLTMLGLEDPQNYIKNIKEEIKITDSLAKEISIDIEKNIFQKIRESVIKRTTQETVSKVEIIDEDKKIDPYREEVDNMDIINKRFDSKSKELQQNNSDIAANIDIIEKQKDKKGDEIVDRNELLKEIEDPNIKKEINDIPKANTELQAAVDLETTNKEEGVDIKTSLEQPKRTINPVHMRTLKSDIVKQKLENPTWVPKIAKKDVMSNQTKEIINDAEKTYKEKHGSTNNNQVK